VHAALFGSVSSVETVRWLRVNRAAVGNSPAMGASQTVWKLAILRLRSFRYVAAVLQPAIAVLDGVSVTVGTRVRRRSAVKLVESR
jgi:hypothetical protein